MALACHPRFAGYDPLDAKRARVEVVSINRLVGFTQKMTHPSNEPRRHHFIPQFYLRRWQIDGGRICEYSLQNGAVKPRSVFPKGTGFVKDLYALTGVSGDLINSIEKEFFHKVDTKAAESLCKIEIGASLNLIERSSWSRFIMAQLHRHPDEIKSMESQSASFLFKAADEIAEKIISESPSHMHFEIRNYVAKKQFNHCNIARKVVTKLSDNYKIGEFINNMIWFTIDTTSARHDLITCDMPILFSNGISKPDGHIAIPIGPRKLFIAVNSDKIRVRFSSLGADEITELSNNAAILYSKRYIYASNDDHIRFIQNRIRNQGINKIVKWAFGMGGD